jgi:hypothetical protein
MADEKPLGMKPIPIEDWIAWPVSDSSDYLDRPPVRYADDDEIDHEAGTDPSEEPLPDE